MRSIRRSPASQRRSPSRVRVHHLVAPLAFGLGLSLSTAALADDGQCPTAEDRAQLSAFAEELRAAPSTEAARERALRKVEQSRRAIDRAAKLVPDDPALREHQRSLRAFEDDVRRAQSPDEVAAGFSALEARADASACQYSTGEVVAIVLGFILGIIPGIILLILLC